MKVKNSILRGDLVVEASSLRSERGENPEYDRALVELVYWAVGGESVEAVAKELNILTYKG